MAKYCTKCGHEINDDAVICVNCGCSTQNNTKYVEQDSDSIGWGFLGFFVPLAGLILWLMWKDEAPIKAKKLGIGALVSVCIDVVGAIIGVIVWATMFGLAVSSSGMAFATIASAFSQTGLLF